MAELLSKESTDSKPYEVRTIDAEVAQAYERGRVDFNFFADLMIPHVKTYDFPDFYLGVFSLLTTRSEKQLQKILRFALGLPRGHAKTTFIKIIIAWLIVYDKVSFVMTICATQPLAQELIADVHDMLSSENARLIYGDWEAQLTTDTKEMKKSFYHGRNIILMSKGADTAVRGVNVKHKRPDLIFCDDAQTKECDDSPTDRLKFRKWLVAMFKIIAPKGDRLIIYVGNMYSEECILFQLKNNPTWVSLITGAIRENGEPLWPELHSLDELMESYFHDEALGEADVWFAEVMNDPIARATSLLHAMLPDFEGNEGQVVPDGVFLTIDPAGFRDISDDNVIAVHYVFEGKGIVAAIDAGIKDPEQLIIRALQLAVQHGASLIGVEDVAYQQTLLFWFKKYMTDWQLNSIEVQPLKPAGRSKEARIRLFIAELYARNYSLFADVRTLFTWQAMAYKIGKKDNKDDILDAVAYGLDVRTLYWHMVTNLKARSLNPSDLRVYTHNTPF